MSSFESFIVVDLPNKPEAVAQWVALVGDAKRMPETLTTYDPERGWRVFFRSKTFESLGSLDSGLNVHNMLGVKEAMLPAPNSSTKVIGGYHNDQVIIAPLPDWFEVGFTALLETKEKSDAKSIVWEDEVLGTYEQKSTRAVFMSASTRNLSPDDPLESKVRPGTWRAIARRSGDDPERTDLIVHHSDVKIDPAKWVERGPYRKQIFGAGGIFDVTAFPRSQDEADSTDEDTGGVVPRGAWGATSHSDERTDAMMYVYYGDKDDIVGLRFDL